MKVGGMGTGPPILLLRGCKFETLTRGFNSICKIKKFDACHNTSTLI